MKFQPNSFNSVQLTERTKIKLSVTRGIFCKLYMQELWLFFMTCRLNVFYKCIRFR